MKKKTIVLLTDSEEEYIDLLVTFGFRKAVAALLIFLGKEKAATSLEIEHGTDLQYSAVCAGLHWLVERGWVRVEEKHSPKAGRRINHYSLAMPFGSIMKIIEDEQKEKNARQSAAFRQMKAKFR